MYFFLKAQMLRLPGSFGWDIYSIFKISFRWDQKTEKNEATWRWCKPTCLCLELSGCAASECKENLLIKVDNFLVCIHLCTTLCTISTVQSYSVHYWPALCTTTLCCAPWCTREGYYFNSTELQCASLPALCTTTLCCAPWCTRGGYIF